MQQTETYKLNLIDKNDTFSPDPLNENTRKLETALAAETDARTGETAGLENRVTALEGHKIATGTYTPTGAPQTIKLGFRPKFVIIQAAMISGDCFVATAAGGCATLTDNGFTLTTSSNPNSGSTKYSYIAVR